MRIRFGVLFLALVGQSVGAQTSEWTSIYTDAESLVLSTTTYSGTLTETSQNDPYEGSNHYRFDYHFDNWWADATLQIRSAPGVGVNVLSSDAIYIAYRYTGSARLAMDLYDLSGERSNLVQLGPASTTNRLASIPVSSFTGIDLSNVSVMRIVLDQVPVESGTVYFDAIRLETLPDNTPPTVPSNLVADVWNSKRVDVSWDPSTDNKDVAGYRVYLDDSPISTVSETGLSLTNLTASTAYEVAVSAIDLAENESVRSDPVAFVMLDADDEPPTTPRHLSVQAISSCQLRLDWTPSQDNIAVDGYRVFRDDTLIKTVLVPPVRDTGLDPETRYAYHVIAFDRDNNQSPASETVLSPATLSALPRITVSNTVFLADGQPIWMNGANTPWHFFNEFGASYDPNWWDAHFAQFNAAGLNASRVWISCSGETGVEIDASGYVSGATALHWQHLDHFFSIAQQHGIYIMATLMSFDHFDRYRPNSQAARWENCINSDANIDSYINNYLIPFLDRYGDNTALWSFDLINEPDWATTAEGGFVPWTRFQRYVSKVAVAIHEQSDALVTVGIGVIKYNSDLTGMNGNQVSDAVLQSHTNHPGAILDFWSPHWYAWMEPYWPIPFYVTPEAFGLPDDRPSVIGENSASGTAGHTLTEDLFAGFTHGWRGAFPWTSNGVDINGGWECVQPAATAFADAYPNDVFPVSWTLAFRIDAAAGAGGDVTPTSVTVPAGGNAVFTLAADPWQRVASVSTNGTPAAESFDNSSTNVTYTWSAVMGDGAVQAAFAPQTAADPAQTPYAWIDAHGLNSGVSWNDACLLDADSDGFLNWQEYLAGTNPTNAASRFKIIDITLDEHKRPVVTFTGSSTNGQTPPFQMWRATDLGGPWERIDDNIPRQANGTNIWTDNAPPPQRPVFYRPQVSAPE